MCGEVVAAPLSLQDTVYPILRKKSLHFCEKSKKFLKLCTAVRKKYKMKRLRRSFNSLSQNLTVLPAPSGREPLARPEALRFSRKAFACHQRAGTLRWARGREGCSDSPLPTSGLHPPRNATTATAASGGNREQLLGQRPARRECRPRHEADAGCRNPSPRATRP